MVLFATTRINTHTHRFIGNTLAHKKKNMKETRKNRMREGKKELYIVHMRVLHISVSRCKLWLYFFFLALYCFMYEWMSRQSPSSCFVYFHDSYVIHEYTNSVSFTKFNIRRICTSVAQIKWIHVRQQLRSHKDKQNSIGIEGRLYLRFILNLIDSQICTHLIHIEITF